jgi:hypothetical protein
LTTLITIVTIRADRMCRGAGDLARALLAGSAAVASGTAGHHPPRYSAGRSGLAEAEQALRALLLEVERTGGRGLDPPDATAEFGHLCPHPGIRKDADAKRKRHRADVIASLERDAERDGGEVRVGELPVLACPLRAGGAGIGLRAGPTGGRPPAAEPPGGWPADGMPQRRQQPERLPVPEHPRGHIQSPGGLRDAHGR